MALFSLTVVVMIVAIIRVAIVSSTTHNIDLSWILFWSIIEMATGPHTYSIAAKGNY